MSEKQRLKLEKFANKKEKQAQQLQHQPSGASKEKRQKKQDVPEVESKDWPAGQ
jgi:valyl-tRNA synthetase